MEESTNAIRAENLTLTQQNLSLRKQITSLRNDRLQLQYKLVETIGAKESFKIEVIKLITQAQNTFERLKTFIEHTTSTPPPPLLSGTEKLLRRQIVGNNQLQQHSPQHYSMQSRQQQQQQQQQQHGILRQIPITKDILQQIPEADIVPPPPPPPSNTPTIQEQHDDMNAIDKKIRKLSTILRTYKRDIENDMQKDSKQNEEKDQPQKNEQRHDTVRQLNIVPNEFDSKELNVNQDNRRCSKRLQTTNVQLNNNNNKENLNATCALMDITNENDNKDMNANIITPMPRGRKRKIIL